MLALPLMHTPFNDQFDNLFKQCMPMPYSIFSNIDVGKALVNIYAKFIYEAYMFNINLLMLLYYRRISMRYDLFCFL